jgi:glycosyltransferase involved in cell wall biosynthesis
VRPRPDYLVLADVMGAELVDHAAVRAHGGRPGRLIERLAGAHALVAWTCFRQRDRYDAILTDGEQVGLPLALLWRLRRKGATAHVMIGHILSVPKKQFLFRLFGLGRRIDAIVVYSSWQERFITRNLRFPPDRVLRSPFMVDTAFFAPAQAASATQSEPIVATAGLERRDYPTLVEAARRLAARVVIAAASNWSKRSDTTAGLELPANVEVRSLSFVPLRQLYADARFVVMPLYDVEFQAGVTTILEAMAMGKPVVCSRVKGQTDVVVDGVTGVYVPPGDATALRGAINELLADAERVRVMGEAARRHAERDCDVEIYAHQVASIVEQAIAITQPTPARPA